MKSTFFRLPMLALGVCLLAVVPVGAQDLAQPAPGAIASVQAGPIQITPTFVLTNLGVDTNVFNVADEGQKRADFTATLQPGIELRARMPRLTLVARAHEGLVYYSREKSEQAANPGIFVGGEYRIGPRVSFLATADAGQAKQRMGFELDIRPTVQTRGVSSRVRLAGRRLRADVGGSYAEAVFDPRDLVGGLPLDVAMNRISKAASVSTGYQLTPYTTLAAAAQLSVDRFPMLRIRDTDSGQATIGVEFKPRALIAGNVAVGVRQLRPIRSQAPRYDGTIIKGGLSWRWQDWLAVSAGAERNADYSYWPDRFFFQYDLWEAGIRYRPLRRWDVGIRGSTTALVYFAHVMDSGGMNERLREVTASTGFVLSSTARIGWYVGQWDRFGAGRPYRTMRSGLELTFGGVTASERGVYVSGPGR